MKKATRSFCWLICKSDYKLYHPEIATIEILTGAPLSEELFCTGNNREIAINIFLHKCSQLELKMAEIDLGESEEDKE